MTSVLKLAAGAIVIAGTVLASGAIAQSSGLKVVDQIKIGGDGGWDYVTFDAGRQALYFAHGTSIASVDLKTKTVNAHLADATGAHIALPVNGGADILITHGKTNLVTINDASTGAVKATIPSDVKPDAAIIEPVTGLAYVMANEGNAVDAIDTRAGKIVAKIAVPGAAEGATVDGQGLVFTHLEDSNAFVVIDARTQKIKATFPINDCEEPSGLAFVADGRLILSACKNGIARVSKADTGEEVATLPIGARPDAALYDPHAKLGFVPSADGKLTVISFDGKPHVVDAVTTKAGARTAALDAETGRVFLPTADFGANDPKTGRPAIVPGTFGVVIVGK